MFNNINNNQINRLNMAECALIKSSQCFQDKNRIKKDLTKLTKNLLLLVGLERVAQELVGGRRWRKLTAPFNSLEPDEVQDWSPSEICYFCNSDKHDSNHNEILKHNDDCPLSSTSNGTESSQLQSSNQSIQPPTSCSCLPSISNGNDSNIPINIPINIPVVQASANIKSVTATSNVTSEQPLDLSLHSRSALIPEVDKSTNHVSDTSSSSSLLRIPQPVQTNTKQGKKNRLETTATTSSSSTSSNWKRAYTEEELQQALNDIQSGKLGTRRAAVIYGIPRSTLRNKVYKLSSDRINVKRGQGSTANNSTVQSTAASSTGSTGPAFSTVKIPSNLPACAAVAAAAAAAAVAAANTTIDSASPSPSTTTSGTANLLHRKSILPVRTGKESVSRNKTVLALRRSMKKTVNDEEETLESRLSSPIVPKITDSHLNDVKNEEDDDDDKNNDSNLIQNDLKQFLKRTITQRAANAKPLVSSGVDSFSSSLDLNNPKTGTDAINMGPTMPNIFTDPLTTLQLLSSMDCGNAIGPLISQILLNVHAFPLANSVSNLINNNFNYNNKPTENMDLNNSLSGTLPLLPELIRKLAQERLEAERLSGSNETQERSMDGNCDSNVILKVPSYQPKLNLDAVNKKEDINNNNIKQEGSISNHSNIGGINTSSSSGVSNLSSHSLGDLNVNMVKDENNNGIDEKRFKLFPVNSDESSSDALINENAKNYNFNRRKVEKRNPTDLKSSDQSAPSNPDLKRNRPKRGRYRNYKRDDLARAVRAVQMGEMSVHRAGTHFGVPHSTLEYKVKERHLLRPKKRQTTSTSGAASLIKKEDGHSLIIPKTNLPDPLVLAPGTGPLNPKPAGLVTQSQLQPQPQQQQQQQQQQSPMEGLSLVNQVNHASLWQSALPLFPLDFGSSQNSTNFFASNIMRKLKENAQLQEEAFNNNSNGSNNANNVSGFSDSNSMGPTSLKDREFSSLLMETLIKSSLERKTLNSMSSANSDSDSRLNRNTSSSVPYRYHNED
ncbi:mushroom body large-type Kenyon cell-specific protein 1 isoform X2 [Tetranychus urticae]|nr:mushroom body large-type Kenyon cell-specific protein 1 isoform X2 [Tetranychus urticae]